MGEETTEARYQREAEFHDQVFAGDTRKVVEKYYSITDASKIFYRNYLTTHCERKRVLEYGCGPHSHALMLAPKGAMTTGIDLSPVAIQRYRNIGVQKKVTTVQGCVMNAECLGFADNSFDLICGTGILHHLDLGSCFGELARTLKPNGSAIFLEPLGHNPVINLYRKLTPALRTVDEHPLMVSDFKQAERHFNRVEVTYFHLSSLGAVLFRGTPWFRAAIRRLDAFDRLLFRSLPFLRKHAWASAMVMSEPRKEAAAAESGRMQLAGQQAR